MNTLTSTNEATVIGVNGNVVTVETTEGAIVLDLQTGDLSTLDVYCDAAHVDPQTDYLYIMRAWADRLELEGDGEGFIELEDGIGEIELE